MTRLRLAADVGGTNTRLGLARDGVLLADTVQSFRNEAFSGFTAVLDQYLQKAASGGVAEVAIAIAGPVTGATARLTNRDWHFDAAALSRHLSGAGVFLLNDLETASGWWRASAPALTCHRCCRRAVRCSA